MPDLEPARGTMGVVLVCSITPPSEVLREAVDETSGPGSAIGSENGRPVVTLESDAPDAVSAVEALEAKAQRLVERLSRYECLIQRTDRLRDRSAEAKPQAGSLGVRP